MQNAEMRFIIDPRHLLKSQPLFSFHRVYKCIRIIILPITLQTTRMKQIPSSLLSQTSINTTSTYSAQQIEKRTFIQRAFAPMNAGAMRGSIFALLASAMGSGMFNLPYRIDKIGIVPFLLYIFAGGLFSYIGMYLISRLIIKFKIQSYSEMCQKSYGKYFRKVAQFCLIFYPWGISVCFQVIFSKFVIQIINDVFKLNFYVEDGGRSTETYNDRGELARIITTIVAIMLNLIFILKKQIGILQKVSIIGVVAIVLNVAIIVLTFLLGFSTKENGTKIDYHGITGLNWGNVNWCSFNGWTAFSENMQGLAAIIFCYVNHQLVFPLVFDLNNPTKRRLDKVFFRVHTTQIAAYLTIGLCGYLLLSEHIDIYPINSVVMGSILTSTMTLGKIFMIVALFFAIPLSLFPARQVVYESFGLQKNNKNHIILSLSLALSGTLIAILFQKVNSYFGLLGGTAGVMMAGGIPAICYYKLKGPRTLNQKLLLCFMAIVSGLGAFGAILSVVYSI